MAGFLQSIRERIFGKPAAKPAAKTPDELLKVLQSRIDAAQTTNENKRHWANADGLGPNAAHDPGIQQTLRNRSRYETLNNSYLKSLVRTKAYDMIGSGPRPQVLIDGDTDGKAAKQIEDRWKGWAESVLLGQSLRLLHKMYERDGGGFLIFRDYRRATDQVRLYPQPVEADQCMTPYDKLAEPRLIDGIELDEMWLPEAYWFLKQHPGEIRLFGLFPAISSQDFERVEARNVVHWFPKDRAGQQRGIPETTPALPVFSQLRRYSLATLTAAEFAAMLAGVLETTLPPDTTGPATVGAWSMFEMLRGALMSMPAGWKATQFKPEQPATTFSEFERTKLNEAGRSCYAPLNVTTGNSTDYNFSSGRLDHVPYHRGAWIDRDDHRLIVMKPMFSAWADEGLQVADYFPAGLPPLSEWKVSWQWDGFDEIDPQKAADAKKTKLETAQTSLSCALAEDGEYWRDVIDQIAIEIEYCEQKGVPHPLMAAMQKAASAPQANAAPPAKPQDPTEDMPPRRAPSRMPSRNGFHKGADHE